MMVDIDKKKPPVTPRAKRYWLSLIFSLVLGLLIGIAMFPQAVQLGSDMANGKDIAFTISPAVAALSAVAWGLILPIFCVIYHKNVDEQEEHAFLWAGLIGWYAMIFITPVWWILSMANIMPPMHAMIVFAIGMIVNAAVYLKLKFF